MTADVITADVPEAGRWVRLVPVEVFGAECDHAAHPEPIPVPLGLCDAVSAWSDCNRAWGSIFRLDDLNNREKIEENTIRMWVPESEYSRLTRKWSDS